jgi:hypothetical protein
MNSYYALRHIIITTTEMNPFLVRSNVDVWIHTVC